MRQNAAKITFDKGHLHIARDEEMGWKAMPFLRIAQCVFALDLRHGMSNLQGCTVVLDERHDPQRAQHSRHNQGHNGDG
jgi:hypothetical protein